MNTCGLPCAPACERNKGPILEVLRSVLPGSGAVLELGSGTGQHVVHFAANLPGLQWQPSDRAEHLPGLRERIRMEGGGNIAAPLELDVLRDWPERKYAAVYSANTAHIMSWPAVCAMFAGVALHLENGGVFCLYGPFNEYGKFTAPTNEAFHRQLREQDPRMGLRDLCDLEKLASEHGLALTDRYSLPANNQVLVFRTSLELKQ